MAKKKKSSGSANSALVTMQKLANQTQLQLQQMVNSANELQTRYNAEEAQKARDWQTDMSMSAHQMEVADLKAAGLNPVLSSGGSGAQSYTTSSASATPESGASALASLQGQQLSGIATMESSRMQAAAQRAAAATSAAAVRAAAASSAAAQKYSADKAVERAKIQKSAQITVAKINKGSTIPGAIEKALKKAGIYDSGLSAIKNKLVQPAKNFLNKISANPAKYFSNSGKVTANNFKLNSSGKTLANNLLNRYGLANNASNRKLVVQAYVFGNQSAVNSIMKSYSSHYKHSSKTSTRTGHK